MKKYLRINSNFRNLNLALILLLIIIFLGNVSLNVIAQEKYDLRFAVFLPSNHGEVTQVYEPWIDRIYEATDGRVKITMFCGETLIKATDTYSGVVSGIADLGMSDFGYNIGRFPVMSTLFLGGIVYNNSKVSSYVIRDFMEKYSPKEIQDTKIMYAYALTPGDLLLKKPVHNLEDLAGMQIRASGKCVDNLEAVGALPVAMPMSDAYEALSKAVIDGNLAPIEVLESYNMAEVCDYVTFTPFMYNIIHYVTMNKDLWNSLPVDIQNIIEEVNSETFEELASVFSYNSWITGKEYAIEKGIELITLSDDEQDRWTERLQPLHEEYISELDKKGYPGREMVETVKELADKYNKEVVLD
jgi:TRAP-type C4-dicarboxylate transport system substrate-binding protein